MEVLNHPYKPKPGFMALALLFFGAGAWYMAQKAMLNDRGLILNGVIHLEREGASNFYWLIAAVCGVFVAIGVPMLLMGLFSSRRLVLTETDITAPKNGFSRTPKTIKLADIRHLEIQQVQKQRFLELTHADGKFTIMESMLPGPKAFDDLCAAVAARVSHLTPRPA